MNWNNNDQEQLENVHDWMAKFVLPVSGFIIVIAPGNFPGRLGIKAHELRHAIDKEFTQDAQSKNAAQKA